MADLHSHHHGGDDATPARARRVLNLVAAAVAVATVLGVAVLWPRAEARGVPPELGFPASTVNATVVSVRSAPCLGTNLTDELTCDEVTAEVTAGPTAGEQAVFQMAQADRAPSLAPGERVVLGWDPGAQEGFRYYWADYQRGLPLWILGALFVGAVLALGRWQGLRALVGLALSLVVLIVFVLPALLEGRSPLLVALVGSAAVAFFALYLAHGFHAGTTTALLGTLASLALTGILAAIFTTAARFTGLADEEATWLQIAAEQVDLRGMLLAGIVIGSLGVLDDVTVTQVSAVHELHRANPSLGTAGLYRAGLRIGRDHISSTVNTLVLAYAGASLPLLLLFSQAGRPLGEILTGELVAVEVVRTLVGSIGLVASVPITTFLAALAVVEHQPRGGRRRREPAPVGRRSAGPRSARPADTRAGGAGHDALEEPAPRPGSEVSGDPGPATPPAKPTPPEGGRRRAAGGRRRGPGVSS